MEFDKQEIIDLLKREGKNEHVQQALNELPDKIDHEQNAQMLEKFGIDPGKLAAQAVEGVVGCRPRLRRLALRPRHQPPTERADRRRSGCSSLRTSPISRTLEDEEPSSLRACDGSIAVEEPGLIGDRLAGVDISLDNHSEDARAARAVIFNLIAARTGGHQVYEKTFGRGPPVLGASAER